MIVVKPHNIPFLTYLKSVIINVGYACDYTILQSNQKLCVSKLLLVWIYDVCVDGDDVYSDKKNQYHSIE